jgi:hypothetical protein
MSIVALLLVSEYLSNLIFLVIELLSDVLHLCPLLYLLKDFWALYNRFTAKRASKLIFDPPSDAFFMINMCLIALKLYEPLFVNEIHQANAAFTLYL